MLDLTTNRLVAIDGGHLHVCRVWQLHVAQELKRTGACARSDAHHRVERPRLANSSPQIGDELIALQIRLFNRRKQKKI